MTGASDIVRDVKTAIAQGEAIVQRTHEEHRLLRGDDDGPRTRAWKRGDTKPRRAPVIDQQPDPSRPSVREMISRIAAFEHAGRPVVAALGLVVLRERFEAIADELPDDERTWPAFVRKHIAIEPARVDALLGSMLHRGGTLRCTRCGVQSVCMCSCGSPYLSEHRSPPIAPMSKPVSALDRAVAAVAAHPEKSTRAIAAEIGVSHQTVKRAREKTQGAIGDVTGDVTTQNQSPGQYWREAHIATAGSAAADQNCVEAQVDDVGGGTTSESRGQIGDEALLRSAASAAADPLDHEAHYKDVGGGTNLQSPGHRRPEAQSSGAGIAAADQSNHEAQARCVGGGTDLKSPGHVVAEAHIDSAGIAAADQSKCEAQWLAVGGGTDLESPGQDRPEAQPDCAGSAAASTTAQLTPTKKMSSGGTDHRSPGHIDVEAQTDNAGIAAADHSRLEDHKTSVGGGTNSSKEPS